MYKRQAEHHSGIHIPYNLPGHPLSSGSSPVSLANSAFDVGDKVFIDGSSHTVHKMKLSASWSNHRHS